ncbi:MAG: transferrin-binding protein-like solute binding protein [Neisseriaceae bacterium]|nr:transferrin-binding protein-like solute binding protein [Neisseriaceae bacterium]
MQLKKLTLATLLALSLAACGGGDDDGTVNPDPNPTPDPDPIDCTATPDAPGCGGDVTVGDEELQPALTDFNYAAGFKADEMASTGSFVVTRQKDSGFDSDVLPGPAQYANRMNAMAIEDANTGNIGFTNILLAQSPQYTSEVDPEVTDATMIEYVGNNPGKKYAARLHSLDEALNSFHTHDGTVGGKGLGVSGESATNAFYSKYSADSNATELQQLNQPNVIVVGAKTAFNAAGLVAGMREDTAIQTNGGAFLGDLSVDYDPTEADTTKAAARAIASTAPGTAYSIETASLLSDAAAARTAYETALTNVANAADTATLTAAKDALKTAKKDWEKAKNALEKELKASHKAAYDNVAPWSGAISGADAIIVADVDGTFDIPTKNKVGLLFAYEYDTTTGKPKVNKPLSTDKSYTDKGNMAADLTTAMDSGLVYIQGGNVYGNDDSYNTTTRIFGHYYLDPGAKTFDSKPALVGEDYNTYLWGDVVGYGAQYGKFAVKPDTFSYVQYGRVTANLDFEESDHPHLKSDGSVEFRISPLAGKNDSDSVDSYFYRGINATTFDQMDKITASNTQINYQGHAIMFGLDNSFHGNKAKSYGHSNATVLGNEGSAGLGNFVEATFDTGSKTVLGDVYNVWTIKTENSDGSKTFGKVYDSLVQFDAKVVGNTLIGSANLTYAPEETGEIRGSFFGPNADELGGSISSVKHTADKGMESGIGWGGAFGAKRVDGPKKLPITHIVNWNGK